MSDEIVRLAARGDGVTAAGHMVPFAAPGDLVDDAGTLTPGPHRATPPCRHFPRCGGCQLQHVDDASYADFLRDRVTHALAAQHIETPEIRPAHLSRPRTRRRVSLRAERRGKQVLLGFNEEKSHRIVDLAQCEIMAPELFALIAPLRILLTVLTGRRTVSMKMTLTDQGVDLALEGVEAQGLAAADGIADFGRAYRIARVTIDEGYGPEARLEPEPVTIMLGGVPVPLPPGGFLQATADGEAALVAGVREAVGDAATVADLFAGLGTFALALSSGAQVHAVEGARDAALALLGAAKRAQRPVAVEHRDLFRRPLTVPELGRFEAVILDPPRAGAKEQAPALAASSVARIAYVSCNPATFARDAKTLVDGGYRLEWIRPVGQFRWSTHVELVGCFAK
jgi:23S rRNA (uracil1939-C5)-methyltransferase